MAVSKCFHHPSKDAVAQCVECGKGICKDCATMYGVSSGEYAGKSLCYDCTAKLVAENVEIVAKHKRKTIFEMVFAGIGMVIGGILGGMVNGDVFSTVLFALIGGGGLGVLKAFGKMLRAGSSLASGHYVGFVDGVIGLFTIFIAPITTIITIVKRIRQIRQASDIISSDARALAAMRSYFTYTQVMEKQNARANLTKLTEQGGELFNNAYAKTVIKKGEATAQNIIRKSVVRIADNGEILRSFDPVKVKPKKGKKGKKAA